MITRHGRWFRIRRMATAAVAAAALQAVTPAEIVPSGRRIDWSAGIPGGIPAVTSPVVSVRDHGARADGVTDDLAAFTAALNALPASGGVLLAPAGNYLLKNTLVIGKPVVLRGEGAGRTVLRFDHGGAARSSIQLTTYARGTWVNMVGGFTKGSTRIAVADPSSFRAGLTLELQQDNDSAVMYTDPQWNQSWAAGAVGQVNTCTGVTGDTVLLERPLYLSYQARLRPQIRTNRLLVGAGIEDLRIVKADSSDGHTIEMKNVERCWVRRVQGDTTMKSHITMNTAYRCEIRQSCFRHSYNYGGSGHGYGVEMGFHVTDCLVEDNVFVHLRHSMMVHIGASGNVFGYNYSREPNSGESWTPCDISMHGHFANNNLFEGNVVQEIDHADSWGPVGPGNTVFRCRVLGEGIDVLDHSNLQNLVGNVLGSGMDTITVSAGVESTLIHGNVVKGSVQWDPAIADHALPSSLYLTAKPGWLGGVAWPAFGPDVSASVTIPAQARWESGNCMGTLPVRPAVGKKPGVRAESGGRGAGRLTDLRGSVIRPAEGPAARWTSTGSVVRPVLVPWDR